MNTPVIFDDIKEPTAPMTHEQLVQHHWVRTMLQDGVALADYNCPDCGGWCYSLRPSGAAVYTTAVICPHCRKLHGRRVHADGRVEFVAVVRLGR